MATILEFMSDDHNRLDAIFDELAGEATPAGASELFADFKAGLSRHIGWEEDILFPIFEDASGMHDSGPTAVMRMEHRQIEKVLEEIDLKVSEGELTALGGLQKDLLAVLGPHNDKEEGILYPATDEMIDDAERQQVIAKLI